MEQFLINFESPWNISVKQFSFSVEHLFISKTFYKMFEISCEIFCETILIFLEIGMKTFKKGFITTFQNYFLKTIPKFFKV